jgi:hypothetical protein
MCCGKAWIVAVFPQLHSSFLRLPVHFQQLENWQLGCIYALRPKTEKGEKLQMQQLSVQDDGAQTMDDQRWKDLCRQIMAEQDPQKLWKLVSELNQEFEQRDAELRSRNDNSESPAEADSPKDQEGSS